MLLNGGDPPLKSTSQWEKDMTPFLPFFPHIAPELWALAEQPAGLGFPTQANM